MDTVNIHEAKTHLSRLIDRVASSGGFIIAKAGKPVAKIVPLSAPDCDKAKRLGFMAGQLRVPDDFDRMGEQEIEALFGGQS
ncbi:type II toxin-antitoxin system Phd/YefM family antitoxin [Sphingobium sp. CFD-1]|uniref:type II toxin-antitoxin system Phd/YefM family antitoxin n=1 Tax=Sphingobium sp. CFD-1 TaxID=2878545 RepID=UPI00214BBD8A|nr:type II toxin-antitoxin system Phd/YefM family antitoxin [Sphingobium sp. CFD-1]